MIIYVHHKYNPFPGFSPFLYLFDEVSIEQFYWGTFEIVKSGGQFSMNNRALWKIDGHGGAGNGTGMGPYAIAYACIVHNPTADADDRYHDASLWSRTLPVDGLIFKNDVKNSGLHNKDADPVELLDSDDENELIHKKERKI